MLDLECESGHIRASTAGPAVAKEYDETVAPVLSYFFETQQALEQQIRASDIPEGLAGVEGVPIQAEGRVHKMLQQHNSARAVALTKQSAKQSGGSGRGGTGSSNPPA
ncbi:hypothetical protein OEZ86_014298 [Tetradesmus obliquus]|nr:hypothetical protein OEZ86_014298 [Tetradesmus obliquus]